MHGPINTRYHRCVCVQTIPLYFFIGPFTSRQEMTWIVGAATSGATDIVLLFYERAEYNKLLSIRFLIIGVFVFLFIFSMGLAVDKL